jgi:UDP-N-acetyl-2-amino-2-deoxyglucuronate dehydrogenase
VRSVKAYADTLVHTMETEDVAVAVLRFANGACGVIAATTGAYPGVTTRIEVFGDGGSAMIENDQLVYLHLRRDDTVDVGPYGGAPASHPVAAPGGTAADPAAVATTSHALQIADMIEAIRDDRPPLLDGETARHAVDVILGVYEAAQSGEEVLI